MDYPSVIEFTRQFRVDCCSVKPLDDETVHDAGALITAEDHWPQGGRGAAALASVAGMRVPIRNPAVGEMPGSGPQTSCWPRPASMPSTSPTPCGRWWGRVSEQ